MLVTSGLVYWHRRAKDCPFSLTDQHISHPYGPEEISPPMVTGLAFGLPLLTIIVGTAVRYFRIKKKFGNAPPIARVI